MLLRGNWKRISTFVVAILLICGGIFCNWGSESVKASADIYVNSATGNDTTGDGSPNSPYKTFHKAYTMAEAGETIDFTGTFTWKDTDETGDATYHGYTIGKNLTILGHGPTETIFQASGTYRDTIESRVFTISTDVTVSISNATIRNGKLSSNSSTGYYDAPGIDNSGTLTINNCDIYDNWGGSGSVYGGGHGGGINNKGSLTVNGSSIHGNYVYWGGGGIYQYSATVSTSLVVTNSTIYSNTISMSTGGAPYGAGISVATGTATITNCTITANTGNSAGGLYVYNTSTAYLKNSIVVGNTANNSTYGNIYKSGAGATLTSNGYNIVGKSSGFSQTTGDWYDSTNGGTFTLTTVGTTGSLNFDTEASYNDSPLKTYTYALRSSSIAINNANSAANNGVETPISDQRGATRSSTLDIGAFEYNGGGLTIEAPTTQASAVVFSDVQYKKMTVSWTGGNGTRRVIFIKAANSGTASPVNGQYYSPNSVFGTGDQIGTSGWYAISEGHTTTVTVTGLTQSTDYIVQVFEYNGIGAGEMNYLTSTNGTNPQVQQSYTPVTRYTDSVNGNDSNDGTEANPWKTFKKTMEVAQPGDTLDIVGTFSWKSAAETGDSNYTGYTLNRDLTIVGQGAENTIFGASDTYNDLTIDSRVFTISAGVTVSMSGVAVRYGRLTSNSTTGYYDAPGIDNSGTLTITNSDLYGNYGNSGPSYGGGAGGAIYNDGILTLTNSSVHGNYAYWSGGGVGSYGANSVATITNSTFYGNTVSMSASGAPYGAGITITGPATITNCTITGNTGNGGGGLYVVGTSANVYIKNNIIAGNSANNSTYSNIYKSSGTLTSNGYNIVGKSSGFTQTTGDWYDSTNGGTFTLNTVGTTGSLNLAETADLNGNSLGTYTYELLENSVAINNGSDIANNSVEIPGADQRGAIRNEETDIGAFEYEGLLEVNTPTTQTSELEFSSVSYGSMNLSWTRGNGYKTIVFIKAASSGTALPVDGASYTANTTFGSGSAIDGWYAVYNGKGTSVSVTDLDESMTYAVCAYEYNGTGAYTKYSTDSLSGYYPRTQATIELIEPTTQASAVEFSSVTSSSITIAWTNGDGEKRVVFVKNAMNGTATPSDLVTYTANTVFESGTQIGSTGWYCVYNGSGSSVTVTGLSGTSSYLVQVFEYNGGAGQEDYLTNSSEDNPDSQITTSAPSEITIGEGTSTTGTSGPAPINIWYASLHGQSVYTAAELNAAGAGGLTEITAVGFYVAAAPVSALPNFTIRMKHTSSTDVSSWQTSDSMTTVRNAANYTPTAGGFDLINLDTPFTWNGTDNIVVDTAFSLVGCSQSGTVRYFTSTNGYRYARSDSSNQTNVFTGGSATTTKPQMKFAFTSAPVSFDLNYSTDANGTVEGTSSQSVGAGQNGSSITAIPNTGYHFVRWSDDSTDNPRTDNGVYAHISVSAVFAINTYSLGYSTTAPGPGAALGHGSLTGSSSQTVEYGSSGSAITAVPDTGYYFVRWSDDSTDNPRTDSTVSGDVSVYAIFTINSYSLTYVAESNGSISGNSSQTIEHGPNSTAVTAVPASGYRFVSWSDGETANPRTDVSVAANKSVSANFELIPLQPSSSGTSTQTVASDNPTDSGGVDLSDIQSFMPVLQKNTTTVEQEDIDETESIVSEQSSSVASTAGFYVARVYEQDGAVILSELRFRILDQSGNPIANLLVTIHSEPRQSRTDKNGVVVFADMPAGDHRIAFEYGGKSISKNIAISEPVVKNEEVQLEVINIQVEDDDKVFPWWGYIAVFVFVVALFFVIDRSKWFRTG